MAGEGPLEVTWESRKAKQPELSMPRPQEKGEIPGQKEQHWGGIY